MYTIEDVEKALNKFKEESGFDLFDLINDGNIYKKYLEEIIVNQDEYDKANSLLNETMMIIHEFYDEHNVGGI
jgi:hypothetical protein